MRRYEYMEPVGDKMKITIAKDRITLRVPVAWGIPHNLQRALVEALDTAYIPELPTLRGRMARGKSSVNIRSESGEYVEVVRVGWFKERISDVSGNCLIGNSTEAS